MADSKIPLVLQQNFLPFLPAFFPSVTSTTPTMAWRHQTNYFSWDKDNHRLSVTIPPSFLRHGRASTTRLTSMLLGENQSQNSDSQKERLDLFDTDTPTQTSSRVRQDISIVDEPLSFYQAQLIHYDMPLVPGIERIKSRLRDALGQRSGLQIPDRIAKLEVRLRKEAGELDLADRLQKGLHKSKNRRKRRDRKAIETSFRNSFRQLSLDTMVSKGGGAHPNHKSYQHLAAHEGQYNVGRFLLPPEHEATLQLLADPSDTSLAWVYLDDDGLQVAMKVNIQPADLVGHGEHIALPFIARFRNGNDPEDAPIRDSTLHNSSGTIKLSEDGHVEFGLNFYHLDIGYWEYGGRRSAKLAEKNKPKTLEEVQKMWSKWRLLAPRNEERMVEERLREERDS